MLIIMIRRRRRLAQMHATMTGFAVAGMDTTVFAYYYFWRAYLLARRQPRGKECERPRFVCFVS